MKKIVTFTFTALLLCVYATAQEKSMRLPECFGEEKATFSMNETSLTISDIPDGEEYNNIMLSIKDIDYKEVATRKDNNSVSFQLPALDDGTYPFWVYISSQRYSTYNHWVGRLGCGRCPVNVYVKNGDYYLVTYHEK